MEEFGSGAIENVTNMTTFNCRSSELSGDNVTDHDFWSLRESIVDGGIPIALFETFIFLLALGWNLFIFITYIVKYSLLKEPANILLFVVSITDIFICIFIIPFPLVVAAAGEFIIGNSDVVRCIVCESQGFFFIFLTEISLHVLAAMSIDRCILLSDPLRYRRIKSVWKTVVGIIFIIIVSFFLALPPAFKFGEWEFNRQFGLCLPRFTPLSNAFYFGFLIIEGLIPVFILAVTNVWTYKIANRFLKKNLERKKSFRATTAEIETENSSYRTQQNQLVKVFGALFIANIASWTPLIVMFVIIGAVGGDRIPAWIYVIGWFFYLLNPTLHPILQSFFIQELRTRVNKAQKTVRSQVRRASRSIIRMATFESFKDIPEMTEKDESEKSRKLFGLKKKVTSQSIGSTTTFVPESPTSSPTAITRANTLTNSGRFPNRERRSESPLAYNTSLGDVRPPASPLPCIDETAQLETADIEQAYQQQQQSSMKASNSSLSDGNVKKKKRHISINVPGEDVYYAERRSSPISPSSSNNSSNDSAIISDNDNGCTLPSVNAAVTNTSSSDNGHVVINVDRNDGHVMDSVRVDSGTAVEYPEYDLHVGECTV